MHLQHAPISYSNTFNLSPLDGVHQRRAQWCFASATYDGPCNNGPEEFGTSCTTHNGSFGTALVATDHPWHKWSTKLEDKRPRDRNSVALSLHGVFRLFAAIAESCSLLMKICMVHCLESCGGIVFIPSTVVELAY